MNERDDGRGVARAYLVVSDLHLRDRGTGPTSAALAALADGVAASDAATTTLVVAGDLLDLTSLAADDAGDWVVRRLDRLVDANLDAFRALAAFVAAGGSLALIAGNHDLELADPAVRWRLVARLEALARAPLGARISFHPWFLHVPGVLYVEHGHRHHDIAATPLPRADPTPTADRRYPLTAHVDAALGARTPARAAQHVVGGMLAIVPAARDTVSAADRRTAASDAAFPDGVLADLDALTARVSPATVARIVRVALARPVRVVRPALVPGLVAAALLAGTRFARAALGATVLGAGFLAVRDRHALWPPPRSTRYLHDAVRRIDAALATAGHAVPVYVMGHTHVGEVRPVDAGSDRAYVNAGSWTAGDDRGRHPFVRVCVTGDVPGAGPTVTATLEWFSPPAPSPGPPATVPEAAPRVTRPRSRRAAARPRTGPAPGP